MKKLQYEKKRNKRTRVERRRWKRIILKRGQALGAENEGASASFAAGDAVTRFGGVSQGRL